MVLTELETRQINQEATGSAENFYVLRQDGMLGIRSDDRWVSPSEWKSASPSDREKVKARWDDLKQLLGIERLNRVQIARLIYDTDARDQATSSAYELFGRMYGIEGGIDVVASKVREYANQANNVIGEMIKQGKTTSYPVQFEMANEVQAKDNPVELALLMLDDRYDLRVRFEAKRKLQLIDLAAKIDQRERQTRIKEHYTNFTDFLDEYVWTPTMKRGETETVYLLSTHDPDTNACTLVKVLDREELKEATIQEGEKINPLRRRKFKPNGREIPIYVSPREKPAEAKILKLLRKGQENPALAVDDEIGLMGVLDSVEDVEAFKKHLRKGAANAGSMITFEEIEDTLTQGEHRPNSIGSSTEVRMFKCFVRMDGTRFEMILHTNQTYLDHLYKDGVAHEEYETRRLFDSGVMERLFPSDIYGYDLEQMRNSSLENVRRAIRSR